jgi:hypothetical protein
VTGAEEGSGKGTGGVRSRHGQCFGADGICCLVEEQQLLTLAFAQQHLVWPGDGVAARTTGPAGTSSPKANKRIVSRRSIAGQIVGSRRQLAKRIR